MHAQQDLQLMQFVVTPEGDTLYVDEIVPARIHPKSYMNRREWMQYYKRVHNFAKAYPYALFISQTIKETDSLFAARGYSKVQQDRYLESIKNDLISNFEPLMRQLTLKQGLMTIKLVDREVGMTPYVIIKKYLGGFNAGFWQLVAKMFKGDIKKQYDPSGEDADLEKLVEYWQQGEFDSLYEFIFNKPRPEIFIPDHFKEPYYKYLDGQKGNKTKKKSNKEILDEIKKVN